MIPTSAPSRGRARLRSERLLLGVSGGLLAAFLVVPLLALGLGTARIDFVAGLRNPLVLPALELSLLTTVTSLVVVVVLGTPLAWTLARASGRRARALESLVELPIVVPPAVAGVALLLAFGRRGIFAVFYPDGWSLAFTTAAVVLAEVFVSAPLFVQAAIAAFRRVDARLVLVARTFGASPVRVFLRVAVPLAAPGLVAGAAMSFARSLGEFGATLMFAGNMSGRTQTLPLAVYTALESDLGAAQALSVVLVLIAFALLVVSRAALARSLARGESVR